MTPINDAGARGEEARVGAAGQIEGTLEKSRQGLNWPVPCVLVATAEGRL